MLDNGHWEDMNFKVFTFLIQKKVISVVKYVGEMKLSR